MIKFVFGRLYKIGLLTLGDFHASLTVCFDPSSSDAFEAAYCASICAVAMWPSDEHGDNSDAPSTKENIHASIA